MVSDTFSARNRFGHRVRPPAMTGLEIDFGAMHDALGEAPYRRPRRPLTWIADLEGELAREIRETALEHSLMSEFTAFVAVGAP